MPVLICPVPEASTFKMNVIGVSVSMAYSTMEEKNNKRQNWTPQGHLPTLCCKFILVIHREGQGF
jgi:hypothetical protein